MKKIKGFFKEKSVLLFIFLIYEISFSI